MAILRQFGESVRTTLFVVGSALVVFAAARNSITWHLQRFWGASGNYWQSIWGSVVTAFGGDDYMLNFWGTVLVSNAAFWGFNFLLMIVDVTGWPKTLIKYKIQPEKNMPCSRSKLLKAVLWVAFNQTVVGLPFFYVMYLVMGWRGVTAHAELPTFHWVLLELGIFSLIEEIMFYYIHRTFHHPFLYKHIHKMHHEWTAPVGVTAIYAHPAEHVLCNLLPPIMGPIVMGSHLATCWMWFCMALTSTTIAHCGYHFPFLPSPEAHDFHHLKFTNNYGVMGILDRLHGTDSMFRQTKAYQRHIMLLGFTPLSQQFPDETKARKKSE